MPRHSHMHRQPKTPAPIDGLKTTRESASSIGANATSGAWTHLQQTMGNQALIQLMRAPKAQARTGVPIQMVHPAFNSVNYWRQPLMNEKGEYVPHPLSYDGQKDRLTKKYGEYIMKLLLHTDLPEDEALARERLTENYMARGGNRWEAYELLQAHPSDNEDLRRMFENALKPADEAYLHYSKLESDSEEVRHFLDQARQESDSTLRADLDQKLKDMSDDPMLAPFHKPMAIAYDMTLKERRKTKKEEQTKLTHSNNSQGMVIDIYGPETDRGNSALMRWSNEVMSGLLSAPYLQTRRIPLNIRIIIRVGIHKDIACTYGHGGLLTVQIDRYQTEEFSPGKMLGLLAHEFGVHSLDETTMSKEELEEESKDQDTSQSGTHGDKSYIVGKTPGVDGQQKDHLTIGRAILGQLSAAPRLNMYEETMISIIEGQSKAEDRRQTAAAYCIDIARIIVTNDNPKDAKFSGFLGFTKLGYQIINAATNEWTRIQAKHGHAHPALGEINIDKTYIFKCLVELAKLINKIDKHGE